MAKSEPKAKASKPGFFKRTASYLTSSYEELKKVIWPTRKELVNHTLIVILICALFVVITSTFDVALNAVYNWATGGGV